MYSQVLRACVELDLFARLIGSPATATELAARLELSLAATTRLLDAAVSLDLLEHLPDARYGLGPLGAAAHGNPAIAAMVRHHDALYADLADPVARLRDRQSTSRLRQFWAYADAAGAQSGTDRTQDYTRLMADSQEMIVEQVLSRCRFDETTRLLDAGGGSGVFAERLAERWPSVAVTVFDLPSVAAQAKTRLEGTPIADRVTCVGGDMIGARWPVVAQDVVCFVRILHDHEDAAVTAMLGHAHAALRPGGRIIIAEPMAGTRGGEAIGAAYFGFYLWTMGQGRARGASEIARLLIAAGFVDVRSRKPPNPLLASVLEARRTAATDGH